MSQLKERSTVLGGALALLREMHCWHYDGGIYPSTSYRNDIDSEPNEEPEEYLSKKAPSRYVQKNHPESQILGEKGSGVQTRRSLVGSSSNLAFMSTIEPHNVSQASKDEC